MSVRAWIGLGGNLGDVPQVLRDAAAMLSALPDIGSLQLSSLYRTPAWGRTDQPDFVNAVAVLHTERAPMDLLDALLEIERTFGRTRSDAAGDQWGPRTLDLDLLLYGDAVITLPGLTVPHPRLHERAFALVPMLELDAGIVIPRIGSAADALARVDRAGIEALP
ncbi:2-amino-4-hydroxy-6-hydroxymethyldihyropteridine pyrophosphokinase [Luteimonas sp. 9C]|uniref:2-amino-4-hydroxy-6- hydroxymethyldihydropteridine diphosphokinase n=1 Tax=Luteimonas sp. 9C TaxID=2653148 RepID=UPI0012EF9A00|nr:2-amino-4-hydroxy-6-hydroxymethyldihydropteridine diphosphokinase [Luteimonas sp. 9C]VXB80171.1 2-amino-4-hydroxy-6-hydroxymethyldihyropteridine pyrophosphokinase [Luteimonas sp. 9C]